MPIPITQFLTSRITGQSAVERPLFTSIPQTLGATQRSRLGNFDSKQFWLKFENSPELLATLSIPITDIMGDRPTWTKPDGSALGRNTRLKAQKFWRDNRGKETIKAWLFDAFLTGDGYLWKGTPKTKDIEKAVKEVLKKSNYRCSKFQLKELLTKTTQDEDLKSVKKFDYVASSSTRIIHSEFDILGYEQQANGFVAEFSPEEIIHYRYLTLNGRVNGFSPVKALWAEIQLIQLVKQNMTSFLENGGSPDKVFILPKEIAQSKNHSYLIDQLRNYKRIQNRHGNLVFTGDLDIKDLQGSPKDLEYKDLALYITSNIAFAYGIPVTRIPYLIGGAAASGSSGLSETGYWNKISDFQDSIEDLLNSQLFNDLGWSINFPRKYKQDEVREAQTQSMAADSITKYQEIFAKNNKQMKTSKILELLGWNEEDIEEFEQSENQVQSGNIRNQNMLDNQQIFQEEAKQNDNGVKRNVANSKDVGIALQNP